MNIKHLIHVLDNQRISNGYITVAAEEVQRHYRAHHRYGCVHFAHDAGMTHDAGRRPITAALI